MPLREQFEYKKGPLYHCINRDENLLPYVVIPLIYYTNREECCEQKRIIDIDHLSFGGIHNSAGKSIVKSTWSYYGKENAKKLIQNATIYDMPINAFIQTQRRQDNISLVPSLYAMRADHKEFKCCIPEEGPSLIPSYICCLNKNLEEESLELIHHLYSETWCEFYHNAGDLITMPKNSIAAKWEKYEKYFITNAKWLENVTSDEFYSIYQLIKNNQ